MVRIAKLLLAICASCVVVVHANGNDIQYAITDLGELGGPISTPNAMNNLGQVVGWAEIYTQYAHAFLYSGSGPMMNLGSFGGDYSVSVATGINNNGMVVGYSDEGGTNPTIAFQYTPGGGMQNLGPVFGSTTSYAWGVNNNGQIVGFYAPASGGDDGFVYNSPSASMLNLGPCLPLCINDNGLVAAIGGSGTEESTYTSSGGTGAWVNIGSLGGSDTQPYGMNNRGDIVGSSATTASGARQAFLYSGGTMTDLGTFGGVSSLAYGINDLGVVVGTADFAGDQSGAAFVYYGSGSIVDLNTLVDPSLGWDIGEATGINDKGQICAAAYKDGEDHALLLTPTPEPSSCCLLCGALSGFLAIQAGTRFLRRNRHDNT